MGSTLSSLVAMYNVFGLLFFTGTCSFMFNWKPLRFDDKKNRLADIKKCFTSNIRVAFLDHTRPDLNIHMFFFTDNISFPTKLMTQEDV